MKPDAKNNKSRNTNRKLGGALAAAFLAVAAVPSAAQAAGPTQAAIVINPDTDQVIYSRNAQTPVYPASTTKLMTAYLTLEAIHNGRLRRDQRLNVSALASRQPRTNLANGARTLGAIGTITVDDALRGLMVHSANDAAVVLAEAVGGSVSGFASMMNAKARAIGMTNSNFVNPNGLPSTAQRTTAMDMATLIERIERDYPELYREYLAVPNFSYNGMGWTNTNRLLNSDVCPGVTGGKTGYIRASGFNIVVSANRNGQRVIVGVFGGASGASRNARACNLINFAYTVMNGQPDAVFDPAHTYTVITPPPQMPPMQMPVITNPPAINSLSVSFSNMTSPRRDKDQPPHSEPRFLPITNRRDFSV